MNDTFTTSQFETIQDIARQTFDEQLSVADPDGKEVSFADLLAIGLTRRQALIVLGLVTGGATIGFALAEIDRDQNESISLSLNDDNYSSIEHTAMNGLIVPIAPGVRLSDAIDPEKMERPIQNAVDLVADTGGRVLLPPTQILESETITLPSKTSIQGYWGNTSISFPPDTDGILFDPDSPLSVTDDDYVKYIAIDGVTLDGPGHNIPTSGVAIRDRGLWMSHFGRVEFRDWNGVTWWVENGAMSFDNRFNYVHFTSCDAGEPTKDGDGLINWKSGGASNYFGYITSFPTNSYSGENSRLFSVEGISAIINGINCGKHSGEAIRGYYNQLYINSLHWEPEDQSSPEESILNLRHSSPFYLSNLKMDMTASAEYAYIINDSGPMQLPVPDTAHDTEITENVLLIEEAPVDHITYHGSSGDVDDNADDETSLVHCIGDFEHVG
ncbi:hypothetical protein [Natrononativus amylolyticus]|uniref:hypothetical protein n=1 Tax=Natrononativus amylolyticus TaxID=2963434 RepID=UPI0020CF0314|nr:hypothetical protein [Natrononativus amylolyticus]